MGVETFIPASSSHVEQVEWDDESEDVTATFNDGQSYRYRNVTRAEWRQLQLSPSVGSFIHRHLKHRGERV